jgi:hypothetical protein
VRESSSIQHITSFWILYFSEPPKGVINLDIRDSVPDRGQPVSGDYQSPFEFRGGTIKQVTVDVSGEPFRDLEKELQAMFARDQA